MIYVGRSLKYFDSLTWQILILTRWSGPKISQQIYADVAKNAFRTFISFYAYTTCVNYRFYSFLRRVCATTLCFKKRHPFYFYDIFVRCRPIYLILDMIIGRSIYNVPALIYLLETESKKGDVFLKHSVVLACLLSVTAGLGICLQGPCRSSYFPGRYAAEAQHGNSWPVVRH